MPGRSSWWPGQFPNLHQRRLVADKNESTNPYTFALTSRELMVEIEERIRRQSESRATKDEKRKGNHITITQHLDDQDELWNFLPEKCRGKEAMRLWRRGGEAKGREADGWITRPTRWGEVRKGRRKRWGRGHRSSLRRNACTVNPAGLEVFHGLSSHGVHS